VSSAVLSTSESIIVSLETSTVAVTSIVTDTVTVTTADTATTTVPVTPAQLVAGGGSPYDGELAVGKSEGSSGFELLLQDADSGTVIDFELGGGQPNLDGQPTTLLYAVQGLGNYGSLTFAAPGQVSQWFHAVSCRVGDDSSLSCQAQTGWSYFVVCPNQGYNWIYIFTDPSTAWAGCSPITLSLVATS
jgi:hypothetical protein